jgi:hypothetical protein
MNYLQSQSMRNNLLFSGIKEDVNEKPDGTELILRNFMTSEMKLAQDLVNEIKAPQYRGKIHLCQRARKSASCQSCFEKKKLLY